VLAAVRDRGILTGLSTVVGRGCGEESALFEEEGPQLAGEVVDVAGVRWSLEHFLDDGQEVVEGADRG
jgi:hypothetical protein